MRQNDLINLWVTVPKNFDKIGWHLCGRGEYVDRMCLDITLVFVVHVCLHSESRPQRWVLVPLAVEVGKEVPSEARARVVEAQLLVNAIDLLQILGRQRKVAFQIL